MLNKIIKIYGVGLLHDAIPEVVKLSKISIIYGENGRGKTTLGAIFSSLAQNNSKLISARKTIGGTKNQQINFLIDNVAYKFENNNWDRLYDKIAIFDSAFVDSNVYSGFNVSSDHREALLEFTLGETGGELKQKVDSLTEKISEITSEIRETRNAIIQIGYPLPLESYIALQRDPEIDQKIDQHEKLLDSVKKADEICNKPILLEIQTSIPDIDRLKKLLSVSISTISAEAKQQVMEHIESHLKIKNEQWIKDGLKLIKTDKCPFCAHNLDSSKHLMDLFQKYFDESYNRHQYELQAYQKTLQDTISDDRISKIQHTFDLNTSNYQSNWKDMVLTTPNIISQSRITEIRDVRNKIQDLITIKLSNPVSAVDITPEFDSGLTKLKALPSIFDDYNSTVKKINTEIQDAKTRLKSTNQSTICRNLDNLRMLKKRYEEGNIAICDKYTELLKAKDSRVKEKEEAKEKFIEYTNEILETFESEINHYLDQFNAGFHIANVDTSHEKGFPRIKYELQLRDFNFELGSSDDALNKPVFSNTLSEGDKRTLAFSFFLAKTLLDPKLSEKIIFIDDPMSSLDQSRQFTTQITLQTLASKGKQLILLSHDPRFLQSFIENENIEKEDVVSFELKRSENDFTVMTSCDLEECIQSAYKKNYRTLSDYVSKGQCVDKILVVKAIRPLIEATLRYRFLDSLKGADGLGKMFAIIEQSQSDSPLFPSRQYLPKLKEINVYSSRQMHDTSASGTVQQISDSELLKYSKFALDFARGL